MNIRLNNKLAGLLAAVLVIAGGVWMIMNPGPEHIEDTNGPDNYALQQITEQDVVAMEMGERGGLTKEESKMSIAGFSVSSGVEYSCKKFTGVSRLYSCTLFKGSDIHIQLANFRVESGNFAFCVVFDGEIVAELTPDEFGTVDFLMENVEKIGDLHYVIAGESANFTFTTFSDWE